MATPAASQTGRFITGAPGRRPSAGAGSPRRSRRGGGPGAAVARGRSLAHAPDPPGRAGPQGQHLDHRVGEGPVGRPRRRSTVAVTDSVSSSTASTRAISAAAWSTAWRASVTRGTAWPRRSSIPRSSRRTWPTSTTDAPSPTMAAMQATTAATSTTTSAVGHAGETTGGRPGASPGQGRGSPDGHRDDRGVQRDPPRRTEERRRRRRRRSRRRRPPPSSRRRRGWSPCPRWAG